ncbi:Protein of unknown function [Bacillus wiedmannii]|uniref:Uncharacterized protein n=1 Tax=Bacillus wiedmannii TaxID=1890302 RepID=A0A1C4ERS9_9BACI|nr:Protein of unknown function [Bacillus wiedmannii]
MPLIQRQIHQKKRNRETEGTIQPNRNDAWYL